MDTQYYLQHQLQAVVSRLCEPIEGLDPAQIAEWLGKEQRDSRIQWLVLVARLLLSPVTQAWIPQAIVVQPLGRMRRDVGRRCWEVGRGS